MEIRGIGTDIKAIVEQTQRKVAQLLLETPREDAMREIGSLFTDGLNAIGEELADHPELPYRIREEWLEAGSSAAEARKAGQQLEMLSIYQDFFSRMGKEIGAAMIGGAFAPTLQAVPFDRRSYDQMRINLFVAGGTIDCERIEEGRVKANIDWQVLMLKDSLYMTDQDREEILKRCLECKEDKIIITHGTDTMVKTAELLGKNIKDKTIVLLGSMVPYNREKSDALFNLGGAVTAVETLPRGVYLSMNGRILTWDNVRKNKELGVFETLR